MYIGVDLGTSAVKLLLMDQEGQVVNIVSREYPLSFPHPGWSEQNPEDWWAAVNRRNQRTDQQDVIRSQVAGISFGGQMHGLVILDEKDQVIRPAILWNDGRTDERDRLSESSNRQRTNLSEYTANIAFAGFTAPKILWVKNNEPENFAKISKDHASERLSGIQADRCTFCTDVSDASGMLIFGCEEQMLVKRNAGYLRHYQKSRCRRLYESYEVVGTVKPKTLQKNWVSPAAVKVAAGAGDNAAAAVGTGTVGDGHVQHFSWNLRNNLYFQ